MLPRILVVVPLIAVLVLSGCTVSQATPNPTPKPQPTTGVKIATPSPTLLTATPTPGPEPAIVVNAPVAGQSVKSPVRVSGTASVFEATVSIAVKDATGQVLGKGITTASAGAPERGTFSADITFTEPITAQAGTVEVYDVSMKDGSVKDLVSVKVNLAGR